MWFTGRENSPAGINNTSGADMSLTFEWAVVTTPRGADPDLDSDYQGMGFDQPLSIALEECIAIAQDAIAQGDSASIRLVRWCAGERDDEMLFDLGQVSGDKRGFPARLVHTWNHMGAKAIVPTAPPVDRPSQLGLGGAE